MSGYTVALMYDYGCGETVQPLEIGVSRNVAMAIKRHYEGIIDRRKLWSEVRQTRIHVAVVNRANCKNLAEYETETEDILAKIGE